MADTETSIAPASSVMPPMPAPTATRERAMGRTAATSVPNTTSRTTRATSRPTAMWLLLSSGALRKTASPPSSTRRPSAPIPETSSDRTPKAGLPISRSGTSRVSTAYPIRPSSETVPAPKGSVTVATWSSAATSSRTSATSPRWSARVVPSVASSTTRAWPLAASGKASSSSCRARSLWLPSAEKSSAKLPPPLVARKPTATSDDDPARRGAPGVPRARHREGSGEPVHGGAFRERCGLVRPGS